MNEDVVQLSTGEFVHLPGSRQRVDSNAVIEARTPLVEKVNNVWGSTAGAGSDFFHTYRKHRSTEMGRLKALEEDHAERCDAAEFQKRRSQLVKLNLERSEKAAARRRKVKEKRKLSQLVQAKAIEVNKFKNDGTFLTLMTQNNFDDKVLEGKGPSVSTSHNEKPLNVDSWSENVCDESNKEKFLCIKSANNVSADDENRHRESSNHHSNPKSNKEMIKIHEEELF